MSYLPKEYELYHYAFGGDIAQNSSLVQQLASPVGRAALLPSLRTRPFNVAHRKFDINVLLSEPNKQRGFNSNLAASPPPDSIAEHKSDEMSWASWLTASPRKGGATKQQAKELFEWNLEEMKARNRQYGPEVCQTIDTYGTRIEELVEAGAFDHTMIRRWRAAQPSITAVVMGPLQMYEAQGLAYRNHKTLLIDSHQVNSSFINHELTHLLGGMRGWHINEPATNILSKAFGVDPNPTNLDNYIFGDILLSQVLTAANIGTRALSGLYSGRLSTLNKHKLGKQVAQQCGQDEIAILDKAIRQETAKLKKVVPLGNRMLYTYATGRILRRKGDPSYDQLVGEHGDLFASGSPDLPTMKSIFDLLDQSLGE